ncbi:CDP-glycerol glycerophosphotransferase family protein [Ornithinimicrobium avium]|uniref:Glycosyltransferase n=1 Tax=Ornithinimicrobium avium TaxID=2283195 RepID=A0A345NNZ5_9MICO|nr:CDP-glycerol glycerophosphotransferase family protein [Ornithinimicrobium avium]AXH96753.1 glycosyltransferase [Ornithinimicrobium avium]
MTVDEPTAPLDPELAARLLALAERRGGARAVERTVLRTRSRTARDLLARAASPARLSAADLLAAVRAAASGDDHAVPPLDLEWTLSLARAVGMQDLDDHDLGDAVLLLRELRRQHGKELLATPAAQQTVVERLWQAGERGLLRSWLADLEQLRPEVRRFLDIDLARTGRDGSLQDPTGSPRWQKLVDTVFTEHGVEPVRVVGGGPATPFDRLSCPVDDPVTDGPLVTVIMPVFRPGPELLTSVRSICAQTWRNLEILVMDDASPPGHEEVLERCAALDERVRVHRMDQNGGTYLARNAALDIARGELVTVQDADDWSHPRRIELQTRALLADPETPATRSFCLRVSEDLVFTRPGYETSQENASSLMFRREQALATVGYFDRSRKSADTEYRRRLELATGRLSTDLPAPLALVRMAGGSLSRADFTPGWHHVSRFVYRAAYERWHAGLAAGADPYLPRFADQRRFAIPQRFQVDQASVAQRPPHYDVVLLSDWRLIGAAQRALLSEVDALTGAGYRVGIAHRESYLALTARRQPLHPRVLDLANAGTVDLVALDQVATVSLLLVRSPDVLQFAPAAASTLDVARVVVVADRAPHALDGGQPDYTTAACDATVVATFCVEPLWVAQGPQVARMLAEEIPEGRVSCEVVGDLLTGDLLPGQIGGQTGSAAGDRPVLGRLAEDAPSAWPATAEDLLAAYPVDGSADVRLLGAATVPLELLGGSGAPEAWSVQRAGEVDPPTFLDQLDVYVHQPHPSTPASFVPEVATAVARGVVAVLPPRFEPVFGEAALYADPAAVPELIGSLHADPDARARQVARGRELVRSRFGPEAYLARVADLVGPPRPDPPQSTAVSPEGTTAQPAGTTPAAPTAAPRPGPAAPDRRRRRNLRLVLTVGLGAAGRLGEVLQRVRDDESLFGTPVTVVHAAGARAEAQEVAFAHPGVDFVAAEGDGRSDLTHAARAALVDSGAPLVAVADLPRSRAVRSFGRAVRLEAARLRQARIEAPLPLLVWTKTCAVQTVAAYLEHALGTAGGREGPFCDYLGGLCLRASTPRLEALDPARGSVDVFVWLSAKLPAGMPRPPWRYRVALVRAGRPVAASAPAGLETRVDNRGHEVWENLPARLPLERAGDGTSVLTLELDTEVEALATSRRLRPAKGVLLDARTVTMPVAPDAGSGDVVRFLVHTARTGGISYLTTQRGAGAIARLRWEATMVRKDLGSVVRRRGSRRMLALRMVRLATQPFFAGRHIMLVGERSDTAQDNGLHLFRHIRRTQPRRHVYYVIDRHSPQRERVAPLGHVVDHSSLRHQLLMLHADVLANAYSIRYLLPAQWTQESYVQHLAWRIGALRVYLKHGVHLNPNAVKRGLSGYDLILTVMPRESEAIRAVSGYDRQVREIGMPRYDGLVPAPPSRTVLFMPTWRQYLVPRLSGRPNPGQIPFEGSAYERFISGFLGSPRLHRMLEEHDFRLTFLPHYNMASSFDGAIASAERIAVADTDATSFQDLLRGCDAFLTDYSSVHFDVAYLGTPVVYARFDEADYESGHASRSWFDYERDGYGPVVRTVEGTLDALEEVLRRGCTMEEVYAARVAGSFTYRDRDNCARVVAALDELSALRRRGIEPS